jgi:hypothetical protein
MEAGGVAGSDRVVPPRIHYANAHGTLVSFHPIARPKRRPALGFTVIPERLVADAVDALERLRRYLSPFLPLSAGRLSRRWLGLRQIWRGSSFGRPAAPDRLACRTVLQADRGSTDRCRAPPSAALNRRPEALPGTTAPRWRFPGLVPAGAGS